ncbi:hypothetical protein B0H15DRAFT_842781 [Mycena belliarum]|uniref:Uncharacterized protein n=1 Tax=Mycena belliarum TaxID=1033014 RepID=A0AAD6U7U7_9AGAR|nr:hypothetical protein B0H15DRAFT_842781 [Mycena belliae]
MGPHCSSRSMLLLTQMWPNVWTRIFVVDRGQIENSSKSKAALNAMGRAHPIQIWPMYNPGLPCSLFFYLLLSPIVFHPNRNVQPEICSFYVRIAWPRRVQGSWPVAAG